MYRQVFPSTLGVYHELIDEIVVELKDRGWSDSRLRQCEAACNTRVRQAEYEAEPVIPWWGAGAIGVVIGAVVGGAVIFAASLR